MKTTPIVLLAVGSLLFATAVVASDRPNENEFQFEFTYDPGSPVDILDDTVHSFALSQTFLAAGVDPSDSIIYLELEIAGLSHTAPMDLQIILVPPHQPGFGIGIMDDAGHFGAGFELVDADILFADKGISLPHSDVEGPILPDTMYMPDGGGAFSQFNGQAVGTDAWLLVLIDDDPRDTGSFDSITLRGVPEPMSLTLLALGAIAVVRRRRR